MNKSTFRAFFAMGALATATAAFGCVADRPSRNGVFNENQYLKKEFLVGSGNGSSDPGWFMQATVLSVSTPNPLGGLGLFPGADGGLMFMRFRVTQDKLQMINVREISATPSPTRTEEVVNAWPITNVDLKYRVNLDGEKTNFYEENQELDWQVRQWVKINFAKNDMSDTAPLGTFFSSSLAKCTDLASASATLVPNSFTVEEHDDLYKNSVNWVVNISVPVKYDDADCVTAYGPAGVTAAQFGRQNLSFNLMYSMMRAKQLDDPANPDAYIPLEVSEKDPIRHKYGVFNIIPIARDVDPANPDPSDPNGNSTTQLLAARQLANRWNPNKPIVYYFLPGVPDYIKDSFRRPGGIKDVSNQVFATAGAKARVDFLNWNDDTTYQDGKGPNRQSGDIRYSFIRWVDDLDANTGWLGLGPNASDPRTGEILQGTINLSNYVQKELAYKIDFFLKSIGESYGLDSTDPQGNPTPWPQAACNLGDIQPLKASTLSTHNGNSTLYNKMQQYLQKPATTYGNLGPEDFTTHQDADFFSAYYAIIPYQMFADPDANPFVVREGGAGIYGPANFWALMAKETQFQKIAASIDQGIAPFEGVTGQTGLQSAIAFHNQFKDLTINHQKLETAKAYTFRQQVWDPPSAFDFVQIMAHAGRHCFLDPATNQTRYETKDEWVSHLTRSFYDHVSIHEFGHTLGLQHNFMGSVDKNNWPVQLAADGKTPVKDANGNLVYSLYTSSQMEYNIRGADMMNTLQWGKYDQGALGWIYGNAQNKDMPLATDKTPKGDSISGQSSSTAKAGSFKAPWNDPYGFDANGNEIQYLYCHHEHITYTPLCRQTDAGSTPSEIIANAIDAYEWDFNFTNYRVYRKFWNNENYANAPAALMTQMRRFLSLWLFDWGSSELADALRRIGIKNPDPNGSDLQYFTSLTNKFNSELSSANKMVAAFHKAIIAQSTGERPVRTVYDTYYGDVTQQGIILDKLFAMQGWVALWPSDNYDQNQAGSYISSYSDSPDSSYQYNAEDTVDFMLGGQYDAFPYFAPLAVAAFAQDTHSPAFNGRIEVRNWIGGHVFTRLEDFLTYFRDLAVQANKCTDVASCTYDPRLPSVSDTHNEFFGPDQRLWIWAYIADRNTWVAVQKEINTAAYVIVRNYTDDVIFQLDDGAFPGGAFSNELPMKYYLDSFNQFN